MEVQRIELEVQNAFVLMGENGDNCDIMEEGQDDSPTYVVDFSTLFHVP